MFVFDQAQTRLSILLRLTRSDVQDELAWEEFVNYYAPVIYRWCLSRKLQDTDAHDVMQQVLMKLAKNLPFFKYDPSKSFRRWLQTLTYHAFVDFLADRKALNSDPWVLETLSTIEAREDLMHQIDDEFDLEVYELAMARVRQRLEPTTWDAFRLTALENRPAAEVAKMLGRQISTIYSNRNRIQKMLQAEVQSILENQERSSVHVQNSTVSE